MESRIDPSSNQRRVQKGDEIEPTHVRPIAIHFSLDATPRPELQFWAR
jgi:hypothetical protein